jgi:radical SAM protein with 4Fe4S-binding SPASM domain
VSCHSFCDEAGFSLDEVKRAAAEGRLLTMEVEFSQLCNFRCPYCYLDARPKDELTSDEIRDLILQARDLGVRKIIILGGEPMIYPRILEKIHFIRNHGMEVEIFTNGSNMTKENAAELALLGVKVVLKMNSRDAVIQNRLCGLDDADRIIRDAFTHLLQAGYGPGGKPMAISSVVSSVNIDELPGMWRWLRDQQIDPYFEMITPQGSAVENDWLSVEPDRVETLFNELAEIDKTAYGREWKPQPPLAGDICLRHQFSCYVNAFGDVMPCVGVTLPVGNIRKNRLADILRDSEVIQNLKNHLQTIKGPCALCGEKESCYGCRGAAYQMTGDYLASDPLCWRNRERQNEIERLPIAVDDFIPQRLPMRMVDTLLSVGERHAEVETLLTDHNPFINEEGQLEPAACMEIIAQAAAALNGFHLRNHSEKPEGFLMGAKSIQIQGTAQLGDRLRTSVYKAHKFEDFGVIHGTVTCKGVCLAEGEITVYHKSRTKNLPRRDAEAAESAK